jgi:hypothetical protein
MNLSQLFRFVLFCFSVSYVLLAAAQSAKSPNGTETFSPYTPTQIRQLNQQPISPAEGPFGPVNPNERRQKSLPLDSRYFSQPLGEQEAEATELQSAEPYDPIPATIEY